FYNVNFMLSEDTFKKLEDPELFSFRYLGKVQAKGKFHPTNVYECFDGDSPDQKSLKTQTLSTFRQGQEAYFAKDMNAALAYFSTVYQANPTDRTVLGFLNRVHTHLEQGLSEDWTGVEMMQVK
ncbi:MAG: adenylate/guanylate cyclase, partial [Saprospiraceae bacterium]